MGVTGSGKTFTMANVIQAVQRPTLVMSHNKTLAAQLYSEFKEFFPHNAVHYFVSYYDYYQPEAYIPQRDIYIEKDASINQQIDRLRLAATSALVSRRDVIIVASVSCIYGLGSPEDYRAMMVGLNVGKVVDRDVMLGKLVDIQYERNDFEFQPGKFRVRGDCVEIWPSYEEFAFRVEFWGDEVEQLSIINPTSGEVIEREAGTVHLSLQALRHARGADQGGRRRDQARAGRAAGTAPPDGKLLEAQRLNARTRFDIEMMQEVGYCPGIENYSRPLSGRPPGSPPDTLFSFFPDDFLLFVDESHVTVPQIRGMYVGDHNRKVTLVEHGFRLPSALDNRPLRFEEWESRFSQVIFVSATPGPYELDKTGGEVVEQVIRPTGLLDPEIEIAPARTRCRTCWNRSASGPGGRARAGDHAHQAAGRGPGGLFQQAGRPLQVAAQRTGRLRARRTAPRSAAGAFRRARGREPAARRARPARGLAGGDPRRRQGRLPAERNVADADHRPLGPKRQRQGAALCRQGDRLDAAGDRRDPPPPRDAAGVQPRARHHAGDDPQGDPRGHRVRGGRARRSPTRPWAGATRPNTSPKSFWPSWKSRCWPRPRPWSSSGPPPSATASSRCGRRWASRWPRPKSTTPPATAAAGRSRRPQAGEFRGPNAGVVNPTVKIAKS